MLRPLALILSVTLAYACPGLDGVNIQADAGPWNYDNALTWGNNPAYRACQTGLQQSPIPLSGGSSSVYRLNLQGYNDKPAAGPGYLYDTGYGPAWKNAAVRGGENDAWTDVAGGERMYLAQIHFHTPSEHTINGTRYPAEIHLVHTNAAGKYYGVIGVPIMLGNPGARETQFLTYFLSEYTNKKSTLTIINTRNLATGLNSMNSYYTYRGSLTTPPCTQGLRWWVSTVPMIASEQWMTELLGWSNYSARPLQLINRHSVGISEVSGRAELK